LLPLCTWSSNFTASAKNAYLEVVVMENLPGRRTLLPYLPLACPYKGYIFAFSWSE
jgi:hypothetical protein